jgi:hypothetical protein
MIGDILADLLQKLAINAPIEAAEIERIRESLNRLVERLDRAALQDYAEPHITEVPKWPR